MKTLRTVGGYALCAMLTMAVYHVAVGVIAYRAAAAMAAENGKEMPSTAAKTLLIYWPGLLVHIAAANDEWNATMASIQETLDEINSGRWQRVSQP